MNVERELLLWPLLLLPAVGAVICLWLRSRRAILASCCGTVVAVTVLGLRAAYRVITTGPIHAAGNWFLLDALSAYHVAVMMIVFLLSSFYAWTYFKHEIEEGHFTLREARRYGALSLGFLSAMSLVLVSNNLAIMWVGIEATTLVSAFLICLHVNSQTLEAMWKYLLVCSVGVAFAFIGTVLAVSAARGLDLEPSEALLWTTLMDSAPSLNAVPLKIGFLFLLVGYGTKAGLAPMHTWLPDAHSQAPSPVSAVFSGFLLNTALYCIMRYIPLVEGATGNTGWCRGLLVFFGLVSIVVAAAFILVQHDLKRLLAYHSVEHMGIIALALGLGGLGYFAALFHTFNHSICKTLSFFAAGRLGQVYNTHDMRQLTDTLRRMRIWGIGLFASLLCLIGVAPFAIFMSELQIVKAAVDSHSFLALVVFLAGSSAVFVGALGHAISMAWEPSEDESAPVRTTMLEAILVIVPLATLLLVGLWIPDFMRVALEQAANILGGSG